MEGFQNETKGSASPETNPYREIQKELRGVMRDMGDLTPESKKQVLDRMILGPEVLSDDPELLVLFDQIAAIEEKYGRERVAELTAFYQH